MDYRIIVIPLIGGIIGYITNSIAITMLFRPHKAVYIGGRRVPFTPGIIPKEKDRLAQSVADTITDNLLNSEVLEHALLDPELVARMDAGLDELVDRYRASDKTLREELETLGRPERPADLAVTEMADSVSRLVADQLEGFQQGEAIAQAALQELKGSYSSREGSFRGFLARAVDDRMVDSMSNQLGGYINRLVSENGPDLIQDFVQRQAENVLDMPVSRVIADYEDQIPRFKQGVLSAYRELVSSSLGPALKRLDLTKVIAERISDFSAEELERMVKSVIHRELRTIVWLGALLGFLIGFLNLLFIF